MTMQGNEAQRLFVEFLLHPFISLQRMIIFQIIYPIMFLLHLTHGKYKEMKILAKTIPPALKPVYSFKKDEKISRWDGTRNLSTIHRGNGLEKEKVYWFETKTLRMETVIPIIPYS
jgi:hypothetical protein